MWGGYHRWKEQKVSSDKEFKAPKWINYPGNAFFAMKMLAIVGALCSALHFYDEVILVLVLAKGEMGNV